MECPRVDTIPGIAGAETDTVVFLVIQESGQFRLEERIDRRLQVLAKNFGDVFFFLLELA